MPVTRERGLGVYPTGAHGGARVQAAIFRHSVNADWGTGPAGGIPAAACAKAYVAAVEGKEQGKTLDAREYARA